MRRTPLNRGTKPLRRHTPLRIQSERRRGEREQRRWALEEVKYRDGDRCWGQTVVAHVCHGPLDGHELIPRSQWRGGHLVPGNIRMVCRSLHEWTHDNPTAATGLGLLRPASDRRYIES